MSGKEREMITDSCFEVLSDKEERRFRQWARDNYKLGVPAEPVWHPVVRDEWSKLEAEKGCFMITRGTGFRLVFANGNSASVQFGPGTYSDHYDGDLLADVSGRSKRVPWSSGSAEVSLKTRNGDWHNFGGDTVAGWTSPDALVKLLVLAMNDELDTSEPSYDLDDDEEDPT